MNLGVVIGRFQVSSLHEGHVALLSAVSAKVDRLLVLVGVTPAALNAHDPLPFFCRADAIRTVFPAATVLPLEDQRNDTLWCQQIHAIVESVTRNLGVVDVTIFGGRDSCLAHYTGSYAKEELNLTVSLSGTEIRKATELGGSYEFRTGLVYAQQSRFPVSFQTIDVAILHGDTVLLGKKLGETALRFPGGFVDPSDESLEMAARRELREECGAIEVSDLRYIGSARINDWRYRASTDKILTSLFVGTYVFGVPKAADDLAEVWWVNRGGLGKVHDAHQPLVKLLETYLEGRTHAYV